MNVGEEVSLKNEPLKEKNPAFLNRNKQLPHGKIEYPNNVSFSE